MRVAEKHRSTPSLCDLPEPGACLGVQCQSGVLRCDCAPRLPWADQPRGLQRPQVILWLFSLTAKRRYPSFHQKAISHHPVSDSGPTSCRLPNVSWALGSCLWWGLETQQEEEKEACPAPHFPRKTEGAGEQEESKPPTVALEDTSIFPHPLNPQPASLALTQGEVLIAASFAFKDPPFPQPLPLERRYFYLIITLVSTSRK